MAVSSQIASVFVAAFRWEGLRSRLLLAGLTTLMFLLAAAACAHAPINQPLAGQAWSQASDTGDGGVPPRAIHETAPAKLRRFDPMPLASVGHAATATSTGIVSVPAALPVASGKPGMPGMSAASARIDAAPHRRQQGRAPPQA